MWWAGSLARARARARTGALANIYISFISPNVDVYVRLALPSSGSCARGRRRRGWWLRSHHAYTSVSKMDSITSIYESVSIYVSIEVELAMINISVVSDDLSFDGRTSNDLRWGWRRR